MNILITGGAGFIGSNLTESLLEKGYKITIIDNLSTGKIENLPKSTNIKFLKGSILNNKILKSAFSEKIDYIIHLAAISSVQKTIKSPALSNKTNLNGTIKIIEFAKKFGVKKIIFTSSAAVYGNPKKLPISENSDTNPLSPYGLDKLTSEKYLSISKKLYNINFLIFRLFNVFGEKQNPSSPYSGVISIFLKEIKKFYEGKKTQIKIFGDGNQTRDFIYIKDVVRIISNSIENQKLTNDIINVGSGKQISINKIIEILRIYLKKLPPIKYYPERKGDIKHSVADISKLKSLGFTAEYSFEKAIYNLLKFQKLL